MKLTQRAIASDVLDPMWFETYYKNTRGNLWEVCFEPHWIRSEVNLRRIIKNTRRECFEPNTGAEDMRGIFDPFRAQEG
jgi:hypothetical protein